MAASRYQNITIEQNADVTVQLNLLDVDGNPKDLENYVAIAQMKKRYNSVATVDFTTAIVFPPSNGVITLSLTNQQTALLEANQRYVYDVIISTDVANTAIVERVAEGKVFVKPGVSTV